MVARHEIEEANERLNRCKAIVADLEAMDAAIGAHALSKVSYTDWNTGNSILLPDLLRRVIDAGIESLIAKLTAQLESIQLTTPRKAED